MATQLTASWWKFVVGGVALFAAVIVGAEGTDLELWWVMIFTLMFGVMSLAAGVILGVSHLALALVRRGPPPPVIG